jgi:SHS2 domain-containing protein
VDFLSEAIYLCETEGLVLASADLDVTETEGGWSLSGVVAGEPIELSQHGLKTLLNSVTYHQLSVRRDRDGWAARVIFDI